jgi:hypothetical protein
MNLSSAVAITLTLNQQERMYTTLYTIAVVLIALWLLGLFTAYTISGFIHILLVIAIVVVLIRLIQGRNVLANKT